MKEGRWIFYADDGSKYIESEYLEDKLHGTSKAFFSNGIVKYEAEYADGEQVSLKKFDSQGNPKD